MCAVQGLSPSLGTPGYLPALLQGGVEAQGQKWHATVYRKFVVDSGPESEGLGSRVTLASQGGSFGVTQGREGLRDPESWFLGPAEKGTVASPCHSGL